MGKMIRLKAADGHEPDAYLAEPAQAPIGAIVLLQEIFGVNQHIRSVADGYAADGFLVIAPALFDRTRRNIEIGYEGDDLKLAYELYGTLKPETALLDAAAAFDVVKTAGKVGVVGYCYGGLLAWLSATRSSEYKLSPACAVGYYPGGVGRVATEQPTCPVLLNFGKEDSHIGQDQIEAVRSAHPDVTIYEYEGAEHGFNNDMRSSYNPEQAKLARQRSLDFLKANLA